MKADISRDTFQAARDIRRVVMQQGRPWLDADFNEQVAVLLHRLDTLAADLFGEYAAVDSGFQIEPVKDKDKNVKPRTFSALRGRYYVRGLMCENDDGYVSPRPEDFENGQTYLVYLHAWEEYRNSLQEMGVPEPALRGVETCGRTRVRWQIAWEKVGEAEKAKDVDKFWVEFKQRWEAPPARLKIRVAAGPAAQEPCRVSGRAMYRGLENTLYRVEAFEPKPGIVQLKWSRNNASSLLPVKKEGKRLRLAGADLGGSFEPHGWIEVHRGPDDEPYAGGTLHKVESLDREAGSIDLETEPDGSETMFARPWSGVLDLKGGWVPLDQGLEISLDTSKKGELRAGQYWLIPVRTEGGGQVYWLKERGLAADWMPLDDELSNAPAALPQEPDLSTHDTLEKPRMVYRRDHYYGPLAFITFDGTGKLDKDTGIKDLRKPYAR